MVLCGIVLVLSGWTGGILFGLFSFLLVNRVSSRPLFLKSLVTVRKLSRRFARVLLSASVERVGVSRMRYFSTRFDFFLKKNCDLFFYSG